MIDKYIREIIDYGIKTGLIGEEDVVYTTNRILEILQLDDYSEGYDAEGMDLEDILKGILDWAYENGRIEENTTAHRDLFDTKIMGAFVSRPSEVNRKFYNLYEKSPEEATNFYYKFSQDTDYIRRYRIARDIKWQAETEYGSLDVTINLSKPEKDPRAIAAARNVKSSSYPKCALCVENEGYAGRINHPARQNHRIIPINIDGKKWGFQYSPYVYYNEHCIVLNSEHTPMTIDEGALRKLFDFVRQFPHYFLGSNADLPIVGGSILSHEHFQGGHYEFAMERAKIMEKVVIKGYEDVKAGLLNWPMAVIRLNHKDQNVLVKLGSHIIKSWKGYTDEKSFIYAKTEGEKHNTVNPIVRKHGNIYELDLVLRNNITTEEHPLGVYHPHEELHHIKKENIGLIEAMGLAILPARLKTEMALLGEYLVKNKDVRSSEELIKHADWANMIKEKYNHIDDTNVDDILKNEIGIVFMRVLEDAGVYKCTEEGREGFRRFVKSL